MKSKISKELFMYHNRIEVLQIYRDLMKKTARALPRRFEREAKLAEWRMLFQDTRHEIDPDQINETKMVLYTIIQRLDHGIYPPFPKD